jgi:hypothetical protein
MTGPKKAVYEVRTVATTGGVIMSELAFTGDGELHAQRMAAWVCDTRDGHVRDGLIALGWTPPKEQGRLNLVKK